MLSSSWNSIPSDSGLCLGDTKANRDPGESMNNLGEAEDCVLGCFSEFLG